MNLLAFISTLLPSFGKNKILESCELTKTSISEHTLPAYTIATELWQGRKFKSKQVTELCSVYTKNVEGKSSNVLASITESLQNGLNVLTLLGEESKKIFSEHEANVSLTYVKSTLLRMIQAAEFANTYSRRFLNMIYVFEAAEQMKEKQTSLSDAELAWLEEGIEDFCLSVNVLRLDIKIIKDHLSKLPDATITALTERTFSTTIGEGKLDPFQLRHISASVNPFYLFGMQIASYQNYKYKSAQEELELLQLRNLQLKKLMEGKPDAKMEKEISYLQDRISSLHFKLEKMEKDYGI